MSYREQRARRTPNRKGLLVALGAGVITGAADDDPSAIGTYASAGAKFGLGFLWIAPVLLPMMYTVVYLSAKLGQVARKGLFAAIRDHFPRWVLFPMMALAIVGNLIEAAADLGGIGAGINILVPIPIPVIVVGVSICLVAFQVFASYALLRKIFQWLALALLAYVVAAVLAKPHPPRGAQGDCAPADSPESGVALGVGCLHRNLTVRLRLHLAVKPGSRRTPLPAAYPPRRFDRNDLFERHPVFHHPDDRRHTASRGSHRVGFCCSGRSGARTAGRARGRCFVRHRNGGGGRRCRPGHDHRSCL